MALHSLVFLLSDHLIHSLSKVFNDALIFFSITQSITYKICDNLTSKLCRIIRNLKIIMLLR